MTEDRGRGERERERETQKEKVDESVFFVPSSRVVNSRPSDDGFFGFFLRRARPEGTKLQVRRKTILSRVRA